MTSFDGMNLPSTLTDLYIGGNSFTSLADASFTDNLTLLYVHNLPLKSLSDATLPDSIQYLYVQLWCSLLSWQPLTRCGHL